MLVARPMNECQNIRRGGHDHERGRTVSRNVCHRWIVTKTAVYQIQGPTRTLGSFLSLNFINAKRKDQTFDFLVEALL